jgi:TonB family protein
MSRILRSCLLALAAVASVPAARADDTAAPSCHAPDISQPAPLNSHAMTADDYPLLSIAEGEEGTVTLDFLIDTQGKVSDAKVLQTSGSARLDDAAVAIAKARWLYRPGTQAGQPVACRWEARVIWQLDLGPIPDDSPFTMIQMSAADYPADARARGEAGTAYVVVIVDETGKIATARVMRSSGFADLDTASLAIVKSRWRPAPAQFSGKPVRSMIGLVLVWSLTGASKQ